MKRIQYHRYGGHEVMRLETFTLPAPGSGEILVRVAAASINPIDWKLRQGMIKFITGFHFPRAMGTDFSGIVEAVGPTVTLFQPGDEVMGTVPFKSSGAFAEKLITHQKLAVKKPATLSHPQAATLPTVGVTAWRALVQKAKLKPGQRVMINGAYGGVGQAAAHIAKSMGASVAGRVGTYAIADAEVIGIVPALDYAQEIPPSLAASFDIVFDCNGSLPAADANRLVKPGGVLLDINPTPAKILRAVLSSRFKLITGSQDPKLLQAVADLAAAGQLSISIGRTASLEDAIPLLRDLESGHRCKGKAVILMP
jgi:NADPH:quinone reductase-like Zn-dependent oxidoreductase